MSPGCARLRHQKIRRHYLVAGLPARKRPRSGQRGPRRSLVLKALLDKHEGLICCSPCTPPSSRLGWVGGGNSTEELGARGMLRRPVQK